MKAFSDFQSKKAIPARKHLVGSEKAILDEKLDQIKKQVSIMSDLLKQFFRMLVSKDRSSSQSETKELMVELDLIFTDAGKDFEKFINSMKPINGTIKEEIKCLTKKMFS